MIGLEDDGNEENAMTLLRYPDEPDGAATMRNYYLLPAQKVAALLAVLFMTRPVILLSGLRHDQFVCAIDMHDVKQIQEQMRSKTGLSSVPFP